MSKLHRRNSQISLSAVKRVIKMEVWDAVRSDEAYT